MGAQALFSELKEESKAVGSASRPRAAVPGLLGRGAEEDAPTRALGSAVGRPRTSQPFGPTPYAQPRTHAYTHSRIYT